MQQRVLTGLPSIAVTAGTDAAGPHDIAFGFSRAFITIGSGGDPALLAPFRTAGIPLGRLIQVSLQGVILLTVDVAGYESTANPDGGLVDSNAFGLEILADRAVMTDAPGGNSTPPEGGHLARRDDARGVPEPDRHAGAGGHGERATSIAVGPDGSTLRR
ncbi:MAG: hypothetical protein R2712_16705 [Vicinamibacterales bacterium]